MISIIINISRISPLFASLINLGLGLVVFYYNRKSQKNEAFFAFSLILFVWALGCFAQSMIKNNELALFWDKIIYTAAVFAPTLLLGTINSFSGKKHKILMRFSYVAGLGLLFMNWFGYFRQGVNINFGARFVTTPAWGWYFYLFLYAILIIFVFYDLYYLIKNTEKKDRKKYLVLLGSIFILIVGGNSYFILIIQKFNPLIDSVLNLNSSLFLGIYSLIMSYLIIKEDLLDFRLIVSRLASYGLIVLGVIIVLGSLLFVFKGNLILQIVTICSVGIILALYGERGRSLIQTGAEQKWITDWYEPTKLLTKISERLTPVLDRGSLISIISENLAQTMKIKTNLSLIAQKDPNGDIIYYRPISGNNNTLKIPKDNIFIKTLSSDNALIQIKKLDKQIKAQISDFNLLEYEICLPLYSQTKLEGIILLGKKISEAPFNQRDLEVLQSVISQAHMVIDRIDPHEKIQQNYAKSLEIAKEVTMHKNFAYLTKQVAHEIMNPVLGIKLALDYALGKIAKSNFENKEKIKERIDRALVGVDRITKVANTTLKYGYVDNNEKIPLDIHIPLKETINLAPVEDRQIITDFAPNLPNVLGDKGRFNQVFLNILLNAIHATKHNSIIKIKTSMVVFNNSAGHKTTGVRIDIADNGEGMSEEQKSKIFDPFYTTKTQGTGLGMAIVYTIVENFAGHLEVTSALNQGTTISIFLPACY